MSRLLLVYPRFPETFWGFQRALRMLSLRTSHPPLGLLTVAGLLPEHHELRLLDLNVEEATVEHWRWADLVLTGGMMIQRPSVEWIVEQCRRTQTPVVVGGPDATTSGDELPRDAHLVLGGDDDRGIVGLGIHHFVQPLTHRDALRISVHRADAHEKGRRVQVDDTGHRLERCPPFRRGCGLARAER